MAIQEHSRYKVFSKAQHPYQHGLADFTYFNESAPDVLTLEDALNLIFSVLYPQTKGVVVNYSDLPAAGNSIGDFYTVTDDANGTYDTPYTGTSPNPSWKNDGDHLQGVYTAGYIWHQYDGDVAPVWHKQVVYDWAADDVVSELITRTANTYVHKKGLDDVDEFGDVIIPPVVDPTIDDYSGQSIWGGQTADTNLTLSANNGDAVGNSGFIQLADHARPTKDLTFNLGTPINRLKRIYSESLQVGTSPLIIQSFAGSGVFFSNPDDFIDFANSVLRTTNRVLGQTFETSQITIVDDWITSATGLIRFGNENLTTTGIVTADQVDTMLLNVDTTTIDDGVLTDTDDDFTFDVLDVHARENVRAERFHAGAAGLVLGTGTNEDNESYDVATYPYGNFNFSTSNAALQFLVLSFKITPTVDSYITDFSGPFDMSAIPTNGNVTAEITSDIAGAPNMGDILHTSPDTTPAATFAAGTYVNDAWTFNNALLLAGVDYWVVLRAIDSTDPNTGQRFRYRYSSTNPTDGITTDSRYSFNGGGLWTNNFHVPYSQWSWTIGGTPDMVVVGSAVYDKDSIVSDADIFTIDSATSITLAKDVDAEDISAKEIIAERLDVDLVSIDFDRIAPNLANIDLRLGASGNGVITNDVHIEPYTTDVLSLGTDSAHQFLDLWLSGSIKKGLLEISVDTLMAFRAMGAANVDDIIKWDGAKWVASNPDLEIDHSEIANLVDTGTLLDDVGHTQFAMLNGRAGSQIISGGTTVSDALYLRAHVGGSTLAIYGTLISPSAAMDLGESTNPFGNFYSSGQMIGPRYENRTDFPSVGSIGRSVWRTDVAFKGLWVDDGVNYVRVGNNSYKKHNFTQVTLLAAHDVSPLNAMDSTWQVKQVSTGEIIGVTIRVSNTNEITVSSDITLPTGAYSLVGVEA